MNWKERFFQDLETRHIFVIGDVMLDRYMWGAVDRISPEAPVPVLSLQTSTSRLGGAANVALNLSSLGCEVSLFGLTGEDDSGKLLKTLARESGISAEGIIALPHLRTTVKTRVIAHHQHLLRVDDEVKVVLDEAETEAFCSNIRTHLIELKPDAIILQDYNKGVLSTAVIKTVLDDAQRAGIPVSVDPKFENFRMFYGVSVFKPNLRELDAQLPFEVTAELEPLKAAVDALRSDMSLDLICVTLSERGIFIYHEGDSAIYPTESREIVDVCGAGDAVISVITLGRLAGLENAKLAELGNAAGGAVCGVVGVAPVTRSMLMQELGLESFL